VLLPHDAGFPLKSRYLLRHSRNSLLLWIWLFIIVGPYLNHFSPVLSITTNFFTVILILPSHLHLCLSSCFSPSDFLTKFVYAFYVHPMNATWLNHLISPYLTNLTTTTTTIIIINNIGLQICSFLLHPFTFLLRCSIYKDRTNTLKQICS
jgi:hypothetical protein